MKACFVYSGVSTAAGNVPVTLQRWSSGAWRKVVSGKTGSGGCATFSASRTVNGAAYRIQLFQQIGTSCQPYGPGIWQASSRTNYGWASASGTLDLGSYWVYHGYIC